MPSFSWLGKCIWDKKVIGTDRQLMMEEGADRWKQTAICPECLDCRDREERTTTQWRFGFTNPQRHVCVLACAYWATQVDEFLPHLSDQVVFGHEGAVQPLVKLNQLSVHLSNLKNTHIDKLASNSHQNRLLSAASLVLGSCLEAGCSMWHFLKAHWIWVSWVLTLRCGSVQPVSVNCSLQRVSHLPGDSSAVIRVSDTDMEAGSSLLFRTCIHLFMEIICQGIFGLAAFCLTEASCHFLTCLSWLLGRTWPDKQAWMSQKNE